MEALEPTVAGVDGDARVFVFGHLALGNLHVNVTGPAPEDERVDDAVLRLVVEHGGSIAAEHGIGRAKARWLGLARSPEELAVQAAIKRALDPGGLLNPGVLDVGAVTAADRWPSISLSAQRRDRQLEIGRFHWPSSSRRANSAADWPRRRARSSLDIVADR